MTSVTFIDSDRFQHAGLTHPPCLPNDFRLRHAAFIAGDSSFAAAARVLASLWRAERGLAAGVHVELGAAGKTRRVRAGWRLTRDAASAGATFLLPGVARLMRRALILREPGAMWDAPKILGNLLASQGLALSVFGPQALDLDLATGIWSKLLPQFVHAVVGIAFETSPGRDEAQFLSDGTAFDVRLDVVTPDGEPAFVALELKFIEAMVGPPASSRPRYSEAARATNLFIDPDADALYSPGVEQIRREHTLAQLMVDHGLYGRGLFILAGPALNRRVSTIAKIYAAELRDVAGATADRVGFAHLSFEAVLAAMREGGAGDLAQAVHDRYLDLRRVTLAALGDEVPPTPSPSASRGALAVPAAAGPASEATPSAAALMRSRRRTAGSCWGRRRSPTVPVAVSATILPAAERPTVVAPTSTARRAAWPVPA